MKFPIKLVPVSVSAERAFQRCQQLYVYRYMRGIKRRDKAKAPQLGIFLHEYLESYYKGIKKRRAPDKAHRWAMRKMFASAIAAVGGQAEIARRMGLEDAALDILNLPARAKMIATDYYEQRGLDDAEEYEILLVEARFEVPDEDFGYQRNGYVDLVARRKLTGEIVLFEHKSGESIPDATIRLLDLQTVIYAIIVEHVWGLHVDEIMWNYLRTKSPVVPDVVYKGTKRESLTRRQDLDTTWETYLNQIIKLGLRPDDYLDVAERLIDDKGRDRWLSAFFPRFPVPLMTEAQILFGDFEETARRMVRFIEYVENGGHVVRSLARDCQWCEMLDLCKTALTGGDEEDIIKLRYTVRDIKEDEIDAITDN